MSSRNTSILQNGKRAPERNPDYPEEGDDVPDISYYDEEDEEE